MWIYTEYTTSRDGHFVKPTLCPSEMANARSTYIFEQYGATTSLTKEVDNMFIDIGGMLCTEDPQEEILLSDGRKFGCWSHQISEVVDLLKNASLQEVDGKQYYRIARWPGVLCYLRKEDREELLKKLKRLINMEKETEHHTKMHEALVEANAYATGVPKEKIREEMRTFIHKGKLNN